MRLDPERGAVTPYAVIFISIVLMFTGLAVDGGAKLSAGWEAVGVAEEAARAGAGQVDRSAVYAGKKFVIDQGAAVRAARSYLSASGHSGSVSIAGPQAIRVRVTVTKKTFLLPLVGISQVSMTATATADLASGVLGRDR